MYCPKCGKQLSDEAVFCGNCGASVNTPSSAQPQEPAAPAVEPEQAPAPDPMQDASPQPEQPAPDPMQGAAPAPEQPAPEQPAWNMPDGDAQLNFDPLTPDGRTPNFKPLRARRGVKKKWIALLVSAAVVVGGAVAVVLNLRRIEGAWTLAFGSDADYFTFVEEEEIGQIANAATSVYSSLSSVTKEPLESDLGISLSVSTELTDAGKNYLSSLLAGADADPKLMSTVTRLLPLLSNSEVQMNLRKVDGRLALELAALCNKSPLASILAVAELQKDGNGKMYLSLPGLSDKVLTADILGSGSAGIGLGGAAVMSPSAPVSTKDAEKILKAMPSDEELNSLITKYIEIALKQLDDVTMEKSSLTVNGVTQNCRVIKVKITEMTLFKLGDALLSALQQDEKVAQILDRLEKAYPREALDIMFDETARKKGFVKSFRDEIGDALEELREEREKLAGGSGQTLLLLTDYVDDHAVIGREIAVADRFVLSLVSAENGGRYASKYALRTHDRELRLTGEGTVKKGAKTGKYTVSAASGSEVRTFFSFSLIDFDASGLASGKLRGTIRVGLTDVPALAGEVPQMLYALQPALALKLDLSDKKSEIALYAYSGDNLLAGATVRAEKIKPGKVEIPAGNQLDASAEGAMEAFRGSIDWAELQRRLLAVPGVGDLLSGFGGGGMFTGPGGFGGFDDFDDFDGDVDDYMNDFDFDRFDDPDFDFDDYLN